MANRHQQIERAMHGLFFAAAPTIHRDGHARPGCVLRLFRLGINHLAGVPFIVFGLLGLALFMVTFGFGVSILSGALTPATMFLPAIIGSTEEAHGMTPETCREAIPGLGPPSGRPSAGLSCPAGSLTRSWRCLIIFNCWRPPAPTAMRPGPCSTAPHRS